jgi:hypothetical protein
MRRNKEASNWEMFKDNDEDDSDYDDDDRPMYATK